MNVMRYRDRASGGRALVRPLTPLMLPGTVLLALPRGGVEVAAEIALATSAPLDVFLVHKLAAITAPDRVVGAVTSRGVCVLNRSVLQEVEPDPAALAEAIACERERVEEREAFFRGNREAIEIEARPVILITDGIANAVTLRAAVAAVRKQSPSCIILAAPVGAPDICSLLAQEVEEVICPLRPDPFFSIGLSYEQFPRVSDERVCDVLFDTTLARQIALAPAPGELLPTPYLDGARL